MIEVANLTKRYGDFSAVSDLSFRVQAGEILGLVGPNGAGKTSTLRCLAGIIPPSLGKIGIAGIDLLSNPVAAKMNLAFFADEPRLFDYLTVRQHLAFIARLYKVDDADARSHKLLKDMDLLEKADALPGELSRGMKQKVALACGFLHAPRAMFFDEPLTGLDPFAIRHTKDLIVGFARQGVAIILSSHLLHLLEEVCTHVLVVDRGRCIAHGTLPEIRQQHGEASLEAIFMQLVSSEASARNDT